MRGADRAGDPAPPDTTPERVTPELISQAAGYYAREMDRVGAGAARVTNKLPMNVVVLGVFAAMFPRGRIVHCRRDPRDVCLSCYCRMFRESMPFTTRLDWLAGYYRAYQRLMDHWVSVFARLEDPPTVHEVRYETLVRRARGDGARRAGRARGRMGGGVPGVGEGRASVTLHGPDQRGVYTTSAGRHRAYEALLGPVTGALADLIEAYERTGGGSA
ncbi:MAG: sulfotransferase [Phycisphaerales bacterium]